MSDKTLKKNKFLNKYGSWALIAGASQGIGLAFSKELAQKGFNLILIALDDNELRQIAKTFQQNYHIKVKTLALDLGDVFTFELIAKATEDKEVGLLVYNATQALIGEFLNHPLANHKKLIEVNISCPMSLLHFFANKMKPRKKGGIILLTSMAAFQGAVNISHYLASKAYNQVLAEGLWIELKEYGIDVLALAPGATDTPNFRASQTTPLPRFSPPVLSPEKVAQEAIRNLGRKSSFIPGFWNRWANWFLQTFIPRNRRIGILSQQTKKLQ